MYIILLVLIIGVIAYRKKVYEGNREAEQSVIGPALDERIDFLLGELEKRGFAVKDEYIGPKDTSKVDSENLKKTLQGLLVHIGMEETLSLTYYSKEESAEQGIGCGKIEVEDDKIILYELPKYKMKDYEAEMIHLCVDKFIEENKFKRSGESEIGRDTDILAVLLGFGKHLHLYKEMSAAEQVLSPYKASKLGYLTSEEMEYTKMRYDKLLIEKRKREEEEERAREREKRILNAKKKLSNRIDGLRREFETNETLIREAIVIDSREIDGEDVKKISELTSKYRDNIYGEELDNLQRKSEHPDKKGEVIKGLDKLDESLRIDSFLISKYRK